MREKKSIFFFLVIGGIFCLFFLFFIFRKVFYQVLPKRTSTSATRPTPTFYPTVTLALKFPKGEKINISGVWVNNFYKTPIMINSFSDVLFLENRKFQIMYLAKFNQILVSVLSSPFDKIRKEAEEELLKTLGVTPAEACQLNVVITTTHFANPEQSGMTYLLSFCKNN